MNTDILFEESQPLTSRKLHRFFKTITAIFAIALFINLFLHKGFDDMTAFLSIGVATFLLATIFSGFELITQIRTDGIYVRFPPLQPSFSIYQWNVIKDVYLRDFHPLREFAGWGIRFGPSGIGYIVAGKNKGLQIDLKNGSSVSISTQCEAEVTEILRKIYL